MKLPAPFTEEKDILNVIIETPRGSRNKFDYDEETGLFKLGKILPAGTFFPLHFGFIPHTKAEDGDPFDALVMMDIPTYPGNWIECRVLGVMQCEQVEKKGKVIRNDRLLTVPSCAKDLSEMKTAKDINKHLLDELINFFSYYNYMEGKKFKLLHVKGPHTAMESVRSKMIKQ